MREPPRDFGDSDVLTAVRAGWDRDLERVEYQPVGFGAHHWAALTDGRPRLFVTFDAAREDLATVASAYAGAQALAADGVGFVLAPLPSDDGAASAAFAGGLLSCTTWYDGTSRRPLDLRWTAEVLSRLHAAAPPAETPRWRPKVGEDLAETTEQQLVGPWGPGPYADDARAAVRRHLTDIARWTHRYHQLAAVARSRQWVACHGEPHHANQLLTAEGRFLVDWDTLRLAPAELDLRVLVENGVSADHASADPEMLEMFDLEWRLDEISQYAAWFEAPHTGTADDRIAIAGLHEELSRREPRW